MVYACNETNRQKAELKQSQFLHNEHLCKVFRLPSPKHVHKTF